MNTYTHTQNDAPQQELAFDFSLKSVKNNNNGTAQQASDSNTNSDSANNDYQPSMVGRRGAMTTQQQPQHNDLQQADGPSTYQPPMGRRNPAVNAQPQSSNISTIEGSNFANINAGQQPLERRNQPLLQQQPQHHAYDAAPQQGYAGTYMHTHMHTHMHTYIHTYIPISYV
jgi:hypothetical protein